EPLVHGLLSHQTPRVRRAALYLLDQPPFTSLRFTDFIAPLHDADASLSSAARRLLEGHQNWAREALPWLREQSMASPTGAGAAALDSLFVAFQSDSGVRGLISELLAPEALTPAATRVFLLNLLPALTGQKPEGSWL